MFAPQEIFPAFNHSDRSGDLRGGTEVIRPMIADNGRHIEWADSLADGVKQAQASGKPLVCVFEEDQCGWCRKFDQELAKPAANAVGDQAIFVRVRPSADPDARMLATNLGINSYPTVSIIDVGDSAFNERRRITGYMSADAFAAAFVPAPATTASTMIA